MQAYVEHRRVDTLQTQEQIGIAHPTVKKAVRAHGNLVLKKTIMERNKNVVSWDSQTAITEPHRYTDEQGVDDVDEEDSTDEQ